MASLVQKWFKTSKQIKRFDRISVVPYKKNNNANKLQFNTKIKNKDCQ